MPLEAGTKLGPYQILAPIGAGGMGEVHKAVDTRLNRTVAIKVLPPQYTEDAERKQRFEREAKAIAALNHPHICTLYDVGRQDGIDFLVMEYLEGETLAQRLMRGALPLDEALKAAIAIADALDKAHGQGVTHRDLKPGNIMLTEAGAKLLDFGLAKRNQPSPSAPASDDPGGIDSTVPGTILGTMPYMAPEQFEGRDVGPRTDLFSFGAVLYEMVTGKRAFDGKSQALLIAAIVSVDPEPISTLQPATPPALQYVVTRCLAKDPEQRMQTAWDLLCQLRWIAEGGAGSVARAPGAGLQKQERVKLLVLVVLLVLVIILARPAYRYVLGSAGPNQVRFLVNLPDIPVPEAVAISPDGQSIAYAGRDAGTSSIFVRPSDSLATRKLPGTEGAGRIFWSPDSRSLAFFAGGQLKRIDVTAATTHNICETPDLIGGSWNSDDVILFASSKGLQRVAAAGGQPVAVSSAGGSPQREPYFLPDGRHYLYLSGTPGKDAAIYAGQLDSTAGVRIVDANSNPVYAEPGYLLYHREGTLYAQPFKASSLSLGGEAIRIADKIPFNEKGAGAFAASQNGILIYRNTPPLPAPTVTAAAGANVIAAPLLWVDSSGKTVQPLGEEAGWLGVDLSPDGKRAAVHRHDADSGDIWIFEPGLANPSKLTFDASQDNSSPIWSPDGKIAFGSRRNGKWGLYTKLADNTGGEKLLQESDSPIVPMSWSRDSKVLVYSTSTPKTAGDIWRLSFTGEKTEAVSFLQTTADERHPQLSPDGRWIAYSSNSSGRSEIYIRPFPAGPGLIQVSVNGGVFPRWRDDGKALYFMSLVSLGAMMAVDLNIRGTEITKTADPRALFQTGFLDSTHAGGNSHAYAVAARGQRFLIPQIDVETGAGLRGARGGAIPPAIQRALATVYADRHAGQSSAAGSMAPINVVLNWTSSLHK